MNIAVIGYHGQLASELRHLTCEHKIKCFGKNEIDVLNLVDIADTLDHFKPDAIINTAAFTAVDLAESEKEKAYELNAMAPHNLAQYCVQKNIKLIHVSTDFVFDGNASSPYKTTSPVCPVSVYGASKAEGEKRLTQMPNLDVCIIRTSWVYSVFGNNFVKSILRLIKEKPALNIVDDQIGSPTCAKNLAYACLDAAASKTSGIVHWTDLGLTSWYDFALAIQELGLSAGLLSKKIDIKPIPSSGYPTPAKRPHYSVLDKYANNTIFNEATPKHWRETLSDMLADLKSKE